MPREINPRPKHIYSKPRLKEKIDAAMEEFVRSGKVVERPQRALMLAPTLSDSPAPT